MRGTFRNAVLVLAALAPALAPASAAAQSVGSERIVAVVGDEVVLLSELEEQTVIAATQAGVAEGDSAGLGRLRRDVLNQMVNDLIVVSAARADDSVSVSQSEVNEAVEAELTEIRSRFPSPAEFESELARSQWRTLDNYRKNLRRIKERELLAQVFLQQNTSRISTPPVSDEEVRQNFEQNRERFGNKPPTVRIRELHLLVRPTDPARERAQALADSLLGEVRRGASFADLAKEFSTDTQSAQKGGDLGYFKRGVMVEPFEEAVFAMDSIGQVEGPVETDFGFHIIRLEDRQGDELKARHILITPEVSDADRSATRTLGEALVDSLAAGADFDTLAARHSSSSGGRLEPIEGPLNQLAPEWQDALRDLPVGGTTGLLTTPAGFAILKLESRTESGPWTFEELEPRIRSQLAQAKGQQAFVGELREQVYVDVRWPGAGVRAAATPGVPEAPADLEPEAPPADLEPEAPAPDLEPEAPPAGVPATDTLPQGERPPPVGAPATDSLPQGEGPPPAGATPQAYTPDAERDAVPAPDLPLEEPAPLADTELPDSVPNPALPAPPEAGRVLPSGAISDSAGLAEPTPDAAEPDSAPPDTMPTGVGEAAGERPEAPEAPPPTDTTAQER